MLNKSSYSFTLFIYLILLFWIEREYCNRLAKDILFIRKFNDYEILLNTIFNNGSWQTTAYSSELQLPPSDANVNRSTPAPNVTLKLIIIIINLVIFVNQLHLSSNVIQGFTYTIANNKKRFAICKWQGCLFANTSKRRS